MYIHRVLLNKTCVLHPVIYLVHQEIIASSIKAKTYSNGGNWENAKSIALVLFVYEGQGGGHCGLGVSLYIYSSWGLRFDPIARRNWHSVARYEWHTRKWLVVCDMTPANTCVWRSMSFFRRTYFGLAYNLNCRNYLNTGRERETICESGRWERAIICQNQEEAWRK